MAKAKAKAATINGVKERITIAPPNIETAVFTIEGTSPYVQHKFSAKAQEIMRGTQEAGSTSRKGKKRDAKDFDGLYKAAMYKAKQGWYGIPAATFRNAMISTCRVVGYAMTMAKLSVFVTADGCDAESGTPLVKITRGTPTMNISPARNKNGGTDLRARPLFDTGWRAVVRVQYDADQFKKEDIANLLFRVGLQNGIGEGRAFSTASNGCGWGFVKLVG